MPEHESWQFIGQRIRWLRKSNQLTIKQLAKGCGLSSNAISLVERGEVAPTVSTLCKIAHALGTTLVTFFDQACPADEPAPNGMPANSDLAPVGCALSSPAQAPGEQGEPASTQPGQPAQPSLLCVSGQLEYALDGQCHHLGPGKTMPIDPARPYILRNAGKETGIALLVFPAHSGQPTQDTDS